MKMRWFVKGVLLSSLLSGVALAAQGCSSQAASYCNKVCECQTCTDQDRQDCADYIDNSRLNAVVAGCDPRFDEAVACLTDQSCNGTEIDESGCAIEIGSMNGCADGYYSTLCKPYQERLNAKYTECGIEVSPVPETVECSPNEGRRDACFDGCLPKMDCPCIKDASGADCATKLQPYNDCITACYQ